MGRAPCCDKANVKKGPWSPEEDAKLKEYIEKYGTGGNWIALPQKVGLKRCGKSCRLRWLNYLRPNIKHGEFSDEEDRIICTLFANIGSRWSIIAAQLPGRTDNDIKNYWNTKLKKKLMSFVCNNNSNNNNIFHQYNYNNLPHRKFMINPPFQNSSHHETINGNSLPHLISSPSSSFHQNSSTTTRSLSSHPNTTTMMMMMTMMNNNTTFDSTNSSSISSYNLSFQGHNQDHDHHSFVDNYYCPVIKDNISSNNNLLMFGTSGSNEGSCSTSSDGSCNYQIKQEEMGFHRQSQTSFVGLLNNINNNYGGIEENNLIWGQKPISGYFGGSSLDDHHHQDHDNYHLISSSSSSCVVVEDSKQVISATSCSINNNNNFTSFFNVDENKTHENNNNFNSKVMYF